MKYSLLVLLFFVSMVINAQNKTNYDESKIPKYELPDPLILLSGEEVTDTNIWIKKRRPEILRLFEEQVYGRIPGRLDISSFEVVEESNSALDNQAVRKQIKLKFKNNNKELEFHILIYLPKDVKNAPVFLAYNFFGNHSIVNDKDVLITKAWVRNNEQFGINYNKATEQSRGTRTNRWAIDKIISSGFGLATIYYGEVDPDNNDFSDGVHPLLYAENQTKPLNNEWGSISAWAWGLTKAMDYFEKDKDIDDSRIIVMGHSRLGKTSLWAGAMDERFAAVISNNSGCGGAALSRRKIGETVEIMNVSFPHWCCTNYDFYNSNENALPIDQHMLIALMAPRPVYIASAEEDKWADPKGEYLSGYYATPVYELFGKKGLSTTEMPAVNQPVQNTIGYHIRSGKHNVTDFDWEQYIKFAKAHFTL